MSKPVKELHVEATEDVESEVINLVKSKGYKIERINES
jgi:hypothetical protein